VLVILLPQYFLHREEALALDEGAFDLAVVEGGIDGVAGVNLDVCAEDDVGVCGYVWFYFGIGGALGEVEVHQQGVHVVAPFVAEFRHFVETIGGEI